MNLTHPFTRLSAVPVVVLLAVIDVSAALGRRVDAIANRNDDGQSTAEYALVLLGAVAIAVGLLSWVSGFNPMGKLFGMVWDKVVSGTKKG